MNETDIETERLTRIARRVLEDDSWKGHHGGVYLYSGFDLEDDLHEVGFDGELDLVALVASVLKHAASASESTNDLPDPSNRKMVT